MRTRYAAAASSSSHFASRSRLTSLAGKAAPALSAAASVLLREHDAVAQDDGRAAHLDVAACLQVLHHPAHHLARGADHLGDVLLRQALGDDLLAVDVFR